MLFVVVVLRLVGLCFLKGCTTEDRTTANKLPYFLIRANTGTGFYFIGVPQ